VLSDVYYIPKLRSNLVSLGQLTETAHRVILYDDVLEVCDKQSDRLIMRVPRTLNRLYKIELKTVEPKCLMAGIGDQA
jgi:predicted DCC family thiol-disulfide oxidoreductase YuxK